MFTIIITIFVILAAAGYFLKRKLFPKKKKFQQTRLEAIIISGPAGVGKGTLIKRLMGNHPNKFGFSVSHTTRDPRPGEVDGREYHFVTREKFEKMISNGEFLESADVHGKLYGTSKAALEKVRSSGAVCILEVDVQGAQRLKKAGLNALFMFIAPPTFEVLRERMIARATETPDKIDTRLKTAETELKFSNDRSIYDKTIVNADLEEAYKQLERSIKLFGGFN